MGRLLARLQLTLALARDDKRRCRAAPWHRCIRPAERKAARRHGPLLARQWLELARNPPIANLPLVANAKRESDGPDNGCDRPDRRPWTFQIGQRQRRGVAVAGFWSADHVRRALGPGRFPSPKLGRLSKHRVALTRWSDGLAPDRRHARAETSATPRGCSRMDVRGSSACPRPTRASREARTTHPHLMAKRSSDRGARGDSCWVDSERACPRYRRRWAWAGD